MNLEEEDNERLHYSCELCKHAVRRQLSRLYYIYDMHDNNDINDIAEWNLLHDILNPSKLEERKNYYY